MNPSLSAALHALRSVVGSEHITSDEATLQAAQTSTFSTEQKILAIIRPASIPEVQACVRIAGQSRIPLYPISRGSNWGYGSRVPVQTNSLLLDLSRLNTIEDFNEELGYFTVGPGVTFRQAFRFLRERRTKLLLSAIGGSPDSSLIGNVVERGIAKGPYGDRAAHVCNFTVVTGTGELLQTGLGRFPGARAAPLHRLGVGPSLDGLFTQSNLGIVVRMTQWLMPMPEYFQLLFYQIARDEALPSVIDALRGLVMSGALRPTLTLYNDYRIMASTGQYPFERANGQTPLPERLREEIRSEMNNGEGVGSWGGDIAIYSPSREIGESTRRLVEKTLQGKISRLSSIEAEQEEIERLLEQPPPEVNSPELLRRGLLMNFLGSPGDDAIRSVYWRKPSSPQTLDPDRDRCGLIWCAPVVPFVGSEVASVLRMMEVAMREHGFEPGLTVQCMTERVVYVVASISYDRDVVGADEAAALCHHRMVEALLHHGYPPYRLSLPLKGTREQMTPQPILEAISAALDPVGIIAPGRYR
jgi:4-cresol dehydrogenase (hydroxylating)